ncbi:MAG TPA: hypothetical protein VG815_05020 [Chloroflexota bacterium]|jgi:hypothetical protein|nr:hypothetical protein [Chloroflexota bacterium]
MQEAHNSGITRGLEGASTAAWTQPTRSDFALDEARAYFGELWTADHSTACPKCEDGALYRRSTSPMLRMFRVLPGLSPKTYECASCSYRIVRWSEPKLETAVEELSAPEGTDAPDPNTTPAAPTATATAAPAMPDLKKATINELMELVAFQAWVEESKEKA